MAMDDVVRHFTADPQAWNDLPFEDFLGSKVAVLATDEKRGQPEVVMLAIEFEPGFYVSPHQHPTGHIEVILEGGIELVDRAPGFLEVEP